MATMKISDLKKHIVDFIPYIGANRCKVTDFSLYANSVGNIVTPDGFAKYNPLFEVGKTYIISGYINGELTGQIQIQTASGYINYNFNTPFTITEEVISLYFRGIPDVLNTFSKIKVEEGTKATPFIPGDTASIIDYTLEEQIIPGEFWLDENGAARQVYCRTFSLQTPSDYNSGSTMVISLVPLGIKACHLEMFQCFSSLNVGGYQGVWLQNGLWQSNPTNGLQLIMEDVTGFDRRNSKCVVSVKYTKA